jgi:histidinol-phosphate aminotransferase
MVDSQVAQWIRPEIQQLSAYHVAAAEGLIKLDAMENPYTWSPELVSAWLRRLQTVTVNRYPDPDAHRLKVRLRHYMDLPEEAVLLLGNGSDELIQMVLLALGSPGRTVVAPEPTFVMYRHIAAVLGLQYYGVPLKENFSLDLPAMLQAVEEQRPAVVFIAYPNNPTGNLFSAVEVQAVIEAAPGVVVIDEAYSAFAGHSFMPCLREYEQLLVMRTLSKIGLAGLRLGMLAGSPLWLKELEKVRLPYNINELTQVSAEFALEHSAELDEQARLICEDRTRLQNALQQLPGVQVYPSDANFILFRTPPGRAEAIFTAIKAQGVLIKNLSGQGGSLTDCLRVTVGTGEENRAFLAALTALL